MLLKDRVYFKALSFILGNYNTLQRTRKKLNKVCELISDRAVQLGSDKQTANKIAENISGRVAADEVILNNDIAQHIIFELKQSESIRPGWVEKVSNEISKNDIFDRLYKSRNIDQNAFVEGLWDGAPNTNKNIVE